QYSPFTIAYCTDSSFDGSYIPTTINPSTGTITFANPGSVVASTGGGILYGGPLYNCQMRIGISNNSAASYSAFNIEASDGIWLKYDPSVDTAWQLYSRVG